MRLSILVFALIVSLFNSLAVAQESEPAIIFQYTGSISGEIMPIDINTQLFTKLAVSNSDSTLFLYNDAFETLDNIEAFNPDMITSITVMKDKEEYLKNHLGIDGSDLVIMLMKTEFDLWTIVRSETEK